MSIKVGINGFGRIGRNIFRAAQQRNPEIEIVAVNDIGEPALFAHLLKYDTALGVLPNRIQAQDSTIVVDGKPIRFLSHMDPSELRWRELGVDLVVESTGHFTDARKAAVHIEKGGARKVIISAPATHQDLTVVLGVNQDAYDPAGHHVISMGSCTTNCLVPVVKVLDDSFGVEHGMMTTIHAYTADQRLQDLPHRDLRRARAAADNIIPTSTGANRAVAEVLPDLAGRFAGISFRVPLLDVSVIDLTVELERAITVDAINQALRAAAAEGPLVDILGYSDQPLVSSDYKSDPRSSIVDGLSTLALGEHSAKVVSWYDNEWGFSCRMVDLLALLDARR
jgi:glyceraldehyde 3-phosphate dehydrogenase